MVGDFRPDRVVVAVVGGVAALAVEPHRGKAHIVDAAIEDRRHAVAGQLLAEVLAHRACRSPPVRHHGSPDVAQILDRIALRQTKSHIDSDLIRRLVLVLARHERVTARRIV
jgi:hypothetical protein